MKLLEKNKRDLFHDLGFGNGFLNKTPNHKLSKIK